MSAVIEIKPNKYVGDGLDDADDSLLGFDPLNLDTDGDGLLDSEEIIFNSLFYR